jgi:hypothetical protein
VSAPTNRIFAVALIALLLMTLAGCGGGEDLDDEPTRPSCHDRSCMI